MINQNAEVRVDPTIGLLEAAKLALFGVTQDADNNGGKVDRHAIAELLRKAIGEDAPSCGCSGCSLN